MTEAKGKRTYTPKRNSLRAKLLVWFTENPGQMIARADIPERFGVSEKSIQDGICSLRRENLIKTIYGPNRTTYYSLALGDVRLPKDPKPKREREWASTSHYSPPRPIPVSIWHFAAMEA